MRLASVFVLLLLATTSSYGQEKTTLKPLVMETPSEPTELKFQFSIKGSFSSAGLYVKDVFKNSPLLRMKSLGKTYALEEGDIIIAIKDSNGRFYLPNSKATSDKILNSLPAPYTEIIVRDVRSGYNYRYQVELLGGGNGGNGNGGNGNGGNGNEGINNASAIAAVKDEKIGNGSIVVLLLGDTQDKSAGRLIQNTLNGLRYVLTKAPSQKKHVRRIIEISGNQFNKNTILNVIKQIDVGADDTLFCFLNGHGAYDPSLNDYSGGHYFQMPGNKSFARKELRDALQSKSARLTCLISESCNVYAPYYLSVQVSAVEAQTNKRFESLLSRRKAMWI